MSLTETKRELDKGLPGPYQAAYQEMVTLHSLGVGKAIEELELLKARHDEMLKGRDFDGLGFYVITFEDRPEILSSGTTQPTHDFRGRKIQDIGHLDKPADWLHFSMLATDTGGAAVFSWLREHDISEGFIESLHELPDDQLASAVVRFAFEFLENTYFSPRWWGDQEKSVRLKLMQRQLRQIPPRFEFPRPDDCLKDDGARPVGWTVQSRSFTREP